MGSIRIAHIADTHLGYRALFRNDLQSGRNQRAVDIERAYEIAIDDMLTRDVQLVIHAGDVFHQTRPTWSALRCFVRHTRRLTDAGVPVLIIGGNHDTPRLRTSGSVFSVMELALPDVQFVCEYEQETRIFEKLNLAVHAVPHGKLASPLPPNVFPSPGMRNVLVTHGLVSSLRLRGQHREPGEEEIADHLLDAELDYIALGHFHVHQRVAHNAWYSGSTERMGFGDEDVTPGYAIVELSEPGSAPDVTHIPIEARSMKSIAPVSCEGRAAREIADLVLARLEREVDSETIARVELKDATRALRREVESILRREAAPLCWHLSVFSRSDLAPLPGEAVAGGEATDIKSLFEEFVAARSYEGDFGARFAERGRRALDDAMHALEASIVDEGAA